MVVLHGTSPIVNLCLVNYEWTLYCHKLASQKKPDHCCSNQLNITINARILFHFALGLTIWLETWVFMPSELLQRQHGLECGKRACLQRLLRKHPTSPRLEHVSRLFDTSVLILRIPGITPGTPTVLFSSISFTQTTYINCTKLRPEAELTKSVSAGIRHAKVRILSLITKELHIYLMLTRQTPVIWQVFPTAYGIKNLECFVADIFLHKTLN